MYSGFPDIFVAVKHYGHMTDIIFRNATVESIARAFDKAAEIGVDVSSLPNLEFVLSDDGVYHIVTSAQRCSMATGEYALAGFADVKDTLCMECFNTADFSDAMAEDFSPATLHACVQVADFLGVAAMAYNAEAIPQSMSTLSDYQAIANVISDISFFASVTQHSEAVQYALSLVTSVFDAIPVPEATHVVAASGLSWEYPPLKNSVVGFRRPDLLAGIPESAYLGVQPLMLIKVSDTELTVLRESGLSEGPISEDYDFEVRPEVPVELVTLVEELWLSEVSDGDASDRDVSSILSRVSEQVSDFVLSSSI